MGKSINSFEEIKSLNLLTLLAMNSQASVQDRINRSNNYVELEWPWVRESRGRAISECEELSSLLREFSFLEASHDKWKWSLNPNGSFTTKKLASLIDEKRLSSLSTSLQTRRNKLVPQKVAIFAWRARQKRLPVRVELDNRGIDLHSLLCPLCEADVESVENIFSNCVRVNEFWKAFLRWWNIPEDKLVILDPFVEDSVFSSFAKNGKSIWEAMKWVCDNPQLDIGLA
ncbi:uncharacterized protein [Rutidosis leptorrhynchoides]|uniref:uncharacterized protein n=1 Tax=Rutidosis leptorrhynchoides TaxID=125765 RepID=UPI003A9A50EF